MIDIPIYIRNLLLVIFLVSGVLLLLHFIGGKKKVHLPHAAGLHQSGITLRGTVTSYQSNAIGDVDALCLNTDSGEQCISFPPHTAREVMNVAAVGQIVHVILDHAPKHNRLVEVTGKSKLAIAPIQPPGPRAETPVNLSGPVTKYNKDAEGGIRSLEIDGYLVVLPPHLSAHLQPLLRKATTVGVNGYVHANGSGFVQLSGLPVLRPFNIRIDNTDFIL